MPWPDQSQTGPPRMLPPVLLHNPVPPPQAQPQKLLRVSKDPCWPNWHQEMQTIWAPIRPACRPHRRLQRMKPLGSNSVML